MKQASQQIATAPFGLHGGSGHLALIDLLPAAWHSRGHDQPFYYRRNGKGETVPRIALLINPPTGLYNREDRCQVSVEYQIVPSIRPPLDLAYLAAILENAGYYCAIADMPAEGKSWSDLRKLLHSLQPDMLLIDSTNPTFEQDLAAAAMAKNVSSRTEVVVKAPHYGYGIAELLRQHAEIDVCLGNEYEQAVVQFCAAGSWLSSPGVAFRNGDKIVCTPEADQPLPLEALPMPARHLLRNELYRRADTNAKQTTIMVGRGCPHGCVFCLSTVFTKGRYQYRSPHHILQEIAICRERYGIVDFFFKADTFTLDESWVLHLCQAILDSGRRISWVCNSRLDSFTETAAAAMRRAGCWGVAFGVETGNAKTMRILGKNRDLSQASEVVERCRRHRLISLCYFVIGFPWEDRFDIQETIKFAQHLSADLIEFHVALPFPGTPLFRYAQASGLIAAGSLPVGADFSMPVIGTKYLSREELYRLKQRALKAVYTDPRHLWRMLARFRRPVAITRLAWFVLRKLWRTNKRPLNRADG